MNMVQNPLKGLAGTTNNKVVSLFSGQPCQSNNAHHIVRLAPELDKLEAIYDDSNAKGEGVYRANILFWALLRDGSVVGMIPWLDQLICCADLSHPGMGRFVGYFDPGVGELCYGVQSINVWSYKPQLIIFTLNPVLKTSLSRSCRILVVRTLFFLPINCKI